MAGHEGLSQRKTLANKRSHEALAFPNSSNAGTSGVRTRILSNNQKAEKEYIEYAAIPEAQGAEECGTGTNDLLGMLIVFLVSACFRFYKIDFPTSVVFDEVHFGKFASYYIRREYFFDVHPPLAKLLIAYAGWIIGYDGHFDFDNIGDDYIANEVPYIGLRGFCAIMGSIVPAVMFGIMRECGFSVAAALFSASLVMIDNAHVTQSRLILLDAPLIAFMCLSFYFYIKFHKHRYRDFTVPWWRNLALTGVFLSLTISCKMVGTFGFLTIGTAVVIDLWNILDIKRGHSLKYVGRHFMARALCLIVLPAIIYLFWFWVHFAVLTRSGTGDEFMSSAFQQTLEENPLLVNAEEIRYYDTLIIQHRTTKAFLHSHPERYPLRYDDGRISSAGQQVTGYPFNDTNNHWIVEPTKEIPDSGRGRIVRHGDIITLRHVLTNSTLMTHDVASTLMATNTEFTTWKPEESKDETWDALPLNCNFQVNIDEGHDGMPWMTKSGHFQLVHIQTRVAMWSHVDPPMPEWAFKQQEVNGNKNLKDRTTWWLVDEIVKDPNVPDILRPPKPPKERKTLPFFKKFFELQLSMLQHNSGLTDSHPYASQPINWPFLLSGISFWTGKEEDKKQIYLIGNPISWYISLLSLCVFIGILCADQLATRRGIYPIPPLMRKRLYNSGGFFLLAWVFHYIPFWTMARQLFLHHYLPAHVFSALVAGVVLQFIVVEHVGGPVSFGKAKQTLQGGLKRIKRVHLEGEGKMTVIVLMFIALIFAGFVFIAPLTYGTPGLNPDQVNQRRIFKTWTLHYAK